MQNAIDFVDFTAATGVLARQYVSTILIFMRNLATESHNESVLEIKFDFACNSHEVNDKKSCHFCSNHSYLTLLSCT